MRRLFLELTVTEFSDRKFPAVAFWRIHLLRFFFLLMAVAMGSLIWSQLFFKSADWHWGLGLGKSMLGALALLSLWGVRYPLQMLPLMVFELVWKTTWFAMIALPAWLNDRMTQDIIDLANDCAGVVILFFVIPWDYVFVRFILQPSEPWRKKT